jgi:hypothetical protein
LFGTEIDWCVADVQEGSSIVDPYEKSSAEEKNVGLYATFKADQV